MQETIVHDRAILKDIYDYLCKYVRFKTDDETIAITLWIAQAALKDVFYYAPRLYITSGTKRCGKTRLLKIIKPLLQGSISMIQPSAASLFTLIEQVGSPLLIDEIDRSLSKKDASDIIAIIDAGFEKDAGGVPRITLEPKRKVEFFKTFCPMLLAGIDKSNIPDTIADRSITIRLKRRLKGELVTPYRPKIHLAEGVSLGERLTKVCESISDTAREMNDPPFPNGIDDRQADKLPMLLTPQGCLVLIVLCRLSLLFIFQQFQSGLPDFTSPFRTT